MHFTHINEKGQARMVDVSEKKPTARRARAGGAVYLNESTVAAITGGELAKGDALATARLAGIMAAKRCDELIPLCHQIALDSVSVDLRPCSNPPRIEIESEVACVATTGAEMEALLAVAIAALTVYDMVKSVDRMATIGDIRLLEKSGGRSGRIVREEK